MTVYWLTPVKSKYPLVLGAERVPCQPGNELDSFRGRLQELHPRLLPLFKSAILVDDEESGACGSEHLALAWDSTEDIRFGPELPLSHCAEAFVDRLPDIGELSALPVADQDWTDRQSEWAGLIRAWHGRGWNAILIREDGHG